VIRISLKILDINIFSPSQNERYSVWHMECRVLHIRAVCMYYVYNMRSACSSAGLQPAGRLRHAGCLNRFTQAFGSTVVRADCVIMVCYVCAQLFLISTIIYACYNIE